MRTLLTQFGLCVVEFHAQNLIDQFGSKKIGGFVDVVRTEFHHIQPDDIVAFVNQFQEINDFPIVHAVRFGCAGGRHIRRVKHIQVDGDVYVVIQLFRNVIHPVG